MRRFGDGDVAIDTVKFAVNRLLENLGAHTLPDGRLAFLQRFEFRLMAIHAIAVRHGGRRDDGSRFSGLSIGEQTDQQRQ